MTEGALELVIEPVVAELVIEVTEAEFVVEGAGAPGPPGPSGTRATFTQSTPAAQWVWVHNLSTKPSVTVFLDSDPNTLVYTDTEYPDLNTVILTFPSPESGQAYI